MADPVISLLIDTPSAAAGLGYLIIGDATHGLIGTGKIAPDAIYADQSAHARSISVTSGVSRFQAPTVRTDTGTLTALLDNRDRAFDPAMNADIVPNRAVKFQVTYNPGGGAVTYDLFTGVNHSWGLAYPGQGIHGDATATIAANDGIAQLTTLNVNATRPAETTGVRIDALANLVNWPRALRAIDPGVTVMPASGLSGSAWSSMSLAADSEMGELFIGPDGTLTFRDRNRVVTESRSLTSQATFGDAGGELKFNDVTLSFDDSQLLNDVTITYNTDGDAVTADDTTSIGQYGIWSSNIQAQINDPNMAAAYAGFILSQYAQPKVRVERLTVKPYRDPTNLFPQVLGRRFGDRITVVFQPPGGGARISHACFIRGIQHSFTALANTRDWTTTFVLQDASTWPSVFIVGTSVLDGPDQIWF